MADFLRAFFCSLSALALLLLTACQTTQAPPVDLWLPPEAIVQEDTLPEAEEHETKEITATPFKLGKEVSAPLGCKLNPEAC